MEDNAAPTAYEYVYVDPITGRTGISFNAYRENELGQALVSAIMTQKVIVTEIRRAEVYFDGEIGCWVNSAGNII